jgi:hypothetical protein
MGRLQSTSRKRALISCTAELMFSFWSRGQIRRSPRSPPLGSHRRIGEVLTYEISVLWLQRWLWFWRSLIFGFLFCGLLFFFLFLFFFLLLFCLKGYFLEPFEVLAGIDVALAQSKHLFGFRRLRSFTSSTKTHLSEWSYYFLKGRQKDIPLPVDSLPSLRGLVILELREAYELICS